MKKIKMPHDLQDATATLAVFGLVGLVTLVGYVVLKNIKKPILPDIDYDNLRNYP